MWDHRSQVCFHVHSATKDTKVNIHVSSVQYLLLKRKEHEVNFSKESGHNKKKLIQHIAILKSEPLFMSQSLEEFPLHLMP